ncbi:hypothetical protein FACS189483_11060 [Spirochaetia bacterium]|nr:hypothetical protein FACS189483_11060 [Spirochaetia bacterium]
MFRKNGNVLVKKVLVPVLAVFAVLALAGCPPLPTDEIDYDNHTTDYSIRVKNNTGYRLVAFKGEIRESRLIGGIPAHASQHGLPKDPALFSTNEDFPLIFITEVQYNANKNNLEALKNAPFTRVFAFYNAQGTNENIYEISGHLGGSYKLTVNNSSDLNVELRVNGVNGETLGYAASNMYNTYLFLEATDYIIFPVFKKYNALRDEVITIFPKYPSGDHAGAPVRTSFHLGDGTVEYVIDAGKYLVDQPLISTGAAFLVIENGTDASATLYAGGTPLRSASGIASVNSAASRTYQIDMPRVPNSDAYTSSITISGYKVTIGGFEYPIPNDTILEVDKIYTFRLQGTLADTITGTLLEQTSTVTLDNFSN